MAATTKTEQPNPGETRKDQKGYQLPEEYIARLVNAEFDRLHERINKITVEALDGAEVIADLAALDSAATLAQTRTYIIDTLTPRLNLIAEILRDMGGLRRTK